MLQQMLAHYFNTRQATFFHLEVPAHDPDRDNSKFRASDAGQCHRKRFWKRLGKVGQVNLSVEMQMALQTGNLLHAFLQYALSREGVLQAAEVEMQDAHRIGHLDAVIKQQHRFILYDFKTVGGKQMYYLKQDSRPKTEHCHQVLTYFQMYAAAQAQIYIDECRIAYLSRDTLEMLDMAVPDDPGLVPAVKRDWETLIGYWERHETPPMTSSQWECKYCQFQAECLPGG